MHKTGLLGLCVPAWNSVRMASSGMTRRDPLANKVALVTASTDGIGFAIARRLAQDGAHVVVSSRKQQNVDQAVATLQGEGLSVTGTVCHVGKAEDRERLVAMLWMDKEKEERMKQTLQIRRLGEPEDCAGIVSFLCSEDASYITGETVVVGGGTPSRL
ncbi:PREDICTED: dehydrogenase/reductase SDR family member 4-like isoform X7 [Colobus angolensis palliatus]|uniref:Dehydrogenase/reductase SDR family member 4 n=1 Tax=Colobus angolensis palliatus TaxID=336983 RepID=A0A2K5JL92_COLAP|nr:PREDICTED: dehydrogenase/reductase SDR family member 4-like isoform X7 [Colobus angolensis palliatus]